MCRKEDLSILEPFHRISDEAIEDNRFKTTRGLCLSVDSYPHEMKFTPCYA